MLFSEYYDLTRTPVDDWFDPELGADTRLFVDPFLIFNDNTLPFDGAHDDLIAFFNRILALVAEGAHERWRSPHWKRALDALRFREPYEFCLGMCATGVRGSGTDDGLGRTIILAAEATIRAGYADINHFEELTLFGEGFGVDRISDIACNVLKQRFIQYTRAVMLRHGLAGTGHRITNGGLSLGPGLRWHSVDAVLPTNPLDPPLGAVLLVPQRFLREMPALDIDDYGSWALSSLNKTLRDRLNYLLAQSTDRKHVLRRFARAHPATVSDYVAHVETVGASAYNLDEDPKLLRPDPIASRFAKSITVATPPSAASVQPLVDSIVEGLRSHIEQQEGWKDLWVDGRFRREKQCQRLLRAVVQATAEPYDVEVAPEAEDGPGPVFIRCRGDSSKAIALDVRRASSSSLRHTALNPAPAYLNADNVESAILVIVQTEQKHLTAKFVASIERGLSELTADTKLQYSVVWIDATDRRSLAASNYAA